jgi:hypothetical protein
VIVPDIHVDYVHWSVERASSIQKIIHHGIPAPFLTCKHYIYYASLNAYTSFVRLMM